MVAPVNHETQFISVDARILREEMTVIMSAECAWAIQKEAHSVEGSVPWPPKPLLLRPWSPHGTHAVCSVMLRESV